MTKHPLHKRWENTTPQNFVGRLCQARYKGGYIIGIIRHLDHKLGLCTVETDELGKVKAQIARLTLLDKDEYV